MASIAIAGLNKSFGTETVLHDISFAAEQGEFVVFVGPSGCGKSTLLRCIAGLEPVNSGSIAFDGREMRSVPAARRGAAMVFQSYALYPNMTVAQNLAFSLQMAGMKRAEIAARVAEAARTLQIEPLLRKKPGALSGGQRQRVAIGRAIVRQPQVFLFDEPLSNLDAALRVQMRAELMDLHRRIATTMIYVTHDQVEAMTMADRIVVLNRGRIAQVGSPLDLYDSPTNRFVASFIGSPNMNFIAARRMPDGSVVPVGAPQALRVACDVNGSSLDGLLEIGLRPEALALGSMGQGLSARIAFVEHLGARMLVHATLDDGRDVVVEASRDEGVPTTGASVTLRPNASRCLVFDASGAAHPARILASSTPLASEPRP